MPQPYSFLPPSGDAAPPTGRPNQQVYRWNADTPPLERRCMGHFEPPHFAYWVFIWDDGSVKEYMPPATYSGSALLKTPEQRIVAAFQATGTSTPVPAIQAAQLVAAGYTVGNYP